MKLTWTKTSPRFMEAVLPSGDVYKLVRDRHDTRYWHASWTPAEEQAAGTLFNFKVTDSEGTPAWAKQKAAAHAEKVQEKRAAGAAWTGEAWRYAAKKNPHYAADFIAPDTAKVVKLFSKSGFTDIHMKKLANPARRVWKVEFHPAMGQTARLRQIVERWSGKLNTTTFVATFAAADDAENATEQAADWGIAGRDTRRAKPKETLVRRNPKDRHQRYAKGDRVLDKFGHPGTIRGKAKAGGYYVDLDGSVTMLYPTATLRPVAKSNPRYASGPYTERVKLPKKAKKNPRKAPYAIGTVGIAYTPSAGPRYAGDTTYARGTWRVVTPDGKNAFSVFDSPTGYPRQGGSGKGAVINRAYQLMGFRKLSDREMRDLLRAAPANFVPHEFKRTGHEASTDPRKH